MHVDYHKQAYISDFIIGVSHDGVIRVKFYTRVDGCYSDYPLWSFDLETIGM